MSDRHLRKEARIRGSGLRNVQVNEFQIISKRRKSSLKNLQSALINNDDLENLPRLRGRASLSRGIPLAESLANIKPATLRKVLDSADSNEGYITPASQINHAITNDEIDYPDNDSSNLAVPGSTEPPKRKPGRPKKQKSNRGRPRKINESSPRVKIRPDEGNSVQFTKSLVLKRLRTSKLKMKLESPPGPSKQVSTDPQSPLNSVHSPDSTPQEPNSPAEIPLPTASESPAPESPASKVSRIRSNVQKRQRALAKDVPVRQSPRLRSRVQAPLTPSNPPVPLSKKKRGEAQKPLVVDIERLTTYKDRDKRTKVHTLDVLKHLVQEFTPSNKPATGKELILQDTFKLHVNHHLDRLMDAHASINEISQKIASCQRLKNEVRNSIYELKKKHNEVGNDLNKVRQEYNNKKRKFEENKTINAQLEVLKTFDTSSEPRLSESVHNDLRELRRVVNPVSGIYDKLMVVNEKLQCVDNMVPNLSR
ncbi:uncharacterized protein CANTADRAFT_22115 [Suhomyces tanzawaensis NRRL Y-17324]|uniref:Inner kinetochore subunit AME1 domain-containing protein n=1 Tax=Suhomyces tanzawaensis NRRL Y-17324 TaxID=984487 RepID=A0A1E4SIW6_9ASCO|nr:uncharacterized protein CANTADRAFT_22115 [Suhomyces tanzawaensis NRRL Y-17324]ODV79372.1 hypothetical protein CANTADRAFT_22115 [Suhomyces tanzawaensis NRRL Y-17324]